jgi:hypothetical protein
VRSEFGDAAVLDDDVALPDAPFVDDVSSTDE